MSEASASALNGAVYRSGGGALRRAATGRATVFDVFLAVRTVGRVLDFADVALDPAGVALPS